MGKGGEQRGREREKRKEREDMGGQLPTPESQMVSVLLCDLARVAPQLMACQMMV